MSNMPRSSLLVSALILLLMALLLACGGNGPTERPDPDRATSLPTSSLTPAPATAEATSTPAAALSTPAPTLTIRPTARPPLAQTSPETDKEALIALYNATNGASWDENDNWLTVAPLDEWHGVTTDDNGRIVELVLVGNQLSGCVPSSLQDKLDMSYSDLGDLRFCP